MNARRALNPTSLLAYAMGCAVLALGTATMGGAIEPPPSRQYSGDHCIDYPCPPGERGSWMFFGCLCFPVETPKPKPKKVEPVWPAEPQQPGPCPIPR